MSIANINHGDTRPAYMGGMKVIIVPDHKTYRYEILEVEVVNG